MGVFGRFTDTRGPRGITSCKCGLGAWCFCSYKYNGVNSFLKKRLSAYKGIQCLHARNMSGHIRVVALLLFGFICMTSAVLGGVQNAPFLLRERYGNPLPTASKVCVITRKAFFSNFSLPLLPNITDNNHSSKCRLPNFEYFPF